jgi:hypothetical protein
MMISQPILEQNSNWITLRSASLPLKVLMTAIVVSMSLGMLGAFGQIVIHDIIPTFFTNMKMDHGADNVQSKSGLGGSDDVSERGDLFGDVIAETKAPETTPFYKNEQFVWTLRWSHIHLFGIGIIFIFMGGVALFLDLDGKIRAWLIALPFIGIWLDIGAMWMKAFVSPVFFWLHVPAGSLFVSIFVFVSIRALWEMWVSSAS